MLRAYGMGTSRRVAAIPNHMYSLVNFLLAWLLFVSIEGARLFGCGVVSMGLLEKGAAGDD